MNNIIWNFSKNEFYTVKKNLERMRARSFSLAFAFPVFQHSRARMPQKQLKKPGRFWYPGARI